MRTQSVLSVFTRSRELATVTRDSILAHNYRHARQCFAFAERWLRAGSSQEKMAIANGFMFSIATLLDQLGQERKRVLAMLPPLLQREYLTQINASGV